MKFLKIYTCAYAYGERERGKERQTERARDRERQNCLKTIFWFETSYLERRRADLKHTAEKFPQPPPLLMSICHCVCDSTIGIRLWGEGHFPATGSDVWKSFLASR